MSKFAIPAVAVVLVLVLAVVGAVVYMGRDDSSKNEDEKTSEKENNDSTQEESTMDEQEETVDNSPVAFSKIGKGILDATEDFSYFTFENGTGSCMDQGFPTDLVYDSENIVKAMNGAYMDDATTSVDFLGNIGFRGLPLTSGSAYCIASTSTTSDKAEVRCLVNEVEVCTASFDFFGVR